MGFRFRKSFKVGGVRINLSKSGVGASVGVKGLRVGVGPRGARVSASVPGSGMGYSARVGGGRARSARQRQRQLEREAAQLSDLYELAVYENWIELLTTMHREPCQTWVWSEVAVAPDPPPASDASPHAAGVIQRQREYNPGLGARLLGKARRTRKMLDAELVTARQADQADHAAEVERLAWLRPVATGILEGDPEACSAALAHLPRLDEVREMGSNLDLQIIEPWCVEARFTAMSDDVVPKQAKTLSAAGNVSTKQMGVTQYWAIYQDHVCSTAIRMAREVFAVLPVPVCLVHGAIPMLDTRTGHVGDCVVLSAAFEQSIFETINFDSIDPSDAMTLFEHRMSFRKTKGFLPVEPLTPADFEGGQ
ncbi:MAG: DUF4236 domain-containing protein [Sandaracinaceae bacterium]|nr:DUF4236 domain-containing protein [Sandaracinaceae bacterium]